MDIIKYSNYFNHINGTKHFDICGILLGIAILKPEFFDFLEYSGNRYKYNTNIFWNDLNHCLSQITNLIYREEDLKKLSELNIEDDWDYLLDVKKASFEIMTTFDTINYIAILDTMALSIDNVSYIIKNPINITEESSGSFSSLGLREEDIYGTEWNNMISTYTKCIIKHLTPEFKELYNEYLYQMGQKNLKLDWDTYQSFTTHGLGFRIDAMPKLYYKSFMEFNIDLAVTESAFVYYDNFIKEWKNIKNHYINKNILIPILKESDKDYHTFLINEFGLAPNDFYRFDKNCNINYYPDKNNFVSGDIKNIDFTINRDKNLTVKLSFENFTVKQIIGFDTIAPSKLKIKHKIDEK